jgi:hypothetical protein
MEVGLVRTAEDALPVLRQASQPLGPMGAEWMGRQSAGLKGRDDPAHLDRNVRLGEKGRRRWLMCRQR